MKESCLYQTGLSPSGEPLIGGVFKMQDQNGFPIDASFEECKSKGLKVDFLEAFCDCWINDCLKFDSFARQSEMIAGVGLEQKWKDSCRLVLNQFPEMMKCENPINEACKYILKEKRK